MAIHSMFIDKEPSMTKMSFFAPKCNAIPITIPTD